MILLNFLRKLIKDDGFELMDANSKSYIIGKPKKKIPIRYTLTHLCSSFFNFPNKAKNNH